MKRSEPLQSARGELRQRSQLRPGIVARAKRVLDRRGRKLEELMGLGSIGDRGFASGFEHACLAAESLVDRFN
jgi:hypothetical protein